MPRDERSDMTVPNEYFAWLVFQVSGLAVATVVALSVYSLAALKRGDIPIPPGESGAALRKALSAFKPQGLRLAMQTFAVPVSLLFLFAAAGTLGHLYVAVLKYGAPTANVLMSGAKSPIPGAILLTTSNGIIFFPTSTRLGTFVPIEEIVTVEDVPPLWKTSRTGNG